ncbi:sensor histidine kinase [Evansella sp. AB-rgal1]|uniref:sensor histidine kinase n=1 Tax=Evansella sp. AB-rgal1 TaxID=3242696 RepID=UPI00359F03FA
MHMKGFKIIDKISFRKKLLFVIILCMSFPILFSMGNTIYTSSKVVQTQTIENETYSLEIGNLYVNKMLDDILQVMNYIHFDSEIKSILNRSIHAPIPPRAYLDVNSKLDYFTRNSNINIYIIPKEGEQNGQQHFVNQNYRGKVDIDIARERSSILDELYTFEVHSFNALDLERDNQVLAPMDQMVLLGRRLIDYNNKTTAYMFAGVNKSEMDKILSSKDINYSRSIVLLDEEGKVLYDESMELVGKEFPYYHEINPNDYRFIEENGNKYLMIHRQMEFSDWSLVSFMSYDEATAPLTKAYTMNLYILGAALFILIISLLFIVNKFTRPIGDLAEIAQEIEKGNLDIRSNIRRNDEIGGLALAFDLMLDQIQEMIKRVKVEQMMKRQAEMEILQSKIKPHFIFNILNTIRIKSLKSGDTETSRLIVSFNKFLRNTYRGEEWITLDEEVKYTMDYLDLINSMRKNPIKVHLHLSSTSLETTVPRFFIQPIVENTCKHGIISEAGNVYLKSSEEGNFVVVSIQDDGCGMDKDRLQMLQKHLTLDKRNIINNYLQKEEKLFGIGLKNIYDRMRLYYGSKFTMNIESELHTGMTVTFRFPQPRRRVNQ